MGYGMTIDQFNHILAQMSRDYRIWAPVRLAGQGPFSNSDLITYRPVSTIDEVVFDQKTVYSAKEAIFKPSETLFYFTAEEFKEPEQDQPGILIFARPCDIHAFRRLDAIFLHNGPHPDYYYQQQRSRVKFILMECGSGFDSCFCVSMGTNKTEDYALAVRLEQQQVGCLVRDPELAPYWAGFTENMDLTPRFVEKNKISVRLPQYLDQGVFNHPLWEEYNHRCTGCGRCTLCCPTCSCFTMQDIFYQDNPRCGERRRVWGSCMIDGFTQLAGGHSFRTTKGDRMRFKVMHKIYDFNRRFGFQMCVGCGRCDDICPEYISLVQCIGKLNQATGEVE